MLICSCFNKFDKFLLTYIPALPIACYHQGFFSFFLFSFSPLFFFSLAPFFKFLKLDCKFQEKTNFLKEIEHEFWYKFEISKTSDPTCEKDAVL